MNLHSKLVEREAAGKPLRIGLIGAGKFGAMYLAQVPKTPGIHLVGIADLSPAGACANLERVGWEAHRHGAASIEHALRERRTHVGEDWEALVAHPAIDIIVEATGNPIAAVSHALAAFKHGKHVVMVTVEADAFCGPLLATRATRARTTPPVSGETTVTSSAGRSFHVRPIRAEDEPRLIEGFGRLTSEEIRLRFRRARGIGCAAKRIEQAGLLFVSGDFLESLEELFRVGFCEFPDGVNAQVPKVRRDGGSDAGQRGQLVVHWQGPPTACPRFQIKPPGTAR